MRIIGFAMLAANAVAFSAPTPAPNIVYILADDLGYGDVQCFNPTRGRIPTPHMDQVAREGMMFTDVHSGSSVCTPTRYGILTGRYAWRTRLQEGVLWGLSAPLIAVDRLTVGHLLIQHGYQTAALGKWHLGMDWAGGPSDAIEVGGIKIDYERAITNGPTTRGFDYFFGISASLDMAPYLYIENEVPAGAASVVQNEWFRSGPADPRFHAGEVLPELTKKAVKYITNRSRDSGPARKPFFLYVALASPHTPIVPGKEWLGRSGLGAYGDFVMETDWAVGEIAAALQRAQLAENTVLIVTSDNGCSAAPAKAAELERNGHYPSAQFRGYKADLWEGGHRVPFIVRWPSRVRPGTRSDQLVCLTDLMATCAEIVGVALPPNAAEDSVSFLPTLLGQTQRARPAVVHHSLPGNFAIREGPWKLMLSSGSGGWTSPNEEEAAKQQLGPVQLYNLANDAGEQRNVADTHPEIVRRLEALLAQYVADGRSTAGSRQQNEARIDIWKSNERRLKLRPPTDTEVKNRK